jgi:hypothetical protein
VGTCGSTLNATFQLTTNGVVMGTLNLPIVLGAPGLAFSENFDGVVAPTLPAGWTASLSGAGSPWVTSTTYRDSLPNAVFASDPSTTSDNQLTSPAFPVTAANGVLSFRHAFSTESCCDSGQLLISIAGGAFTEFTAAGGTFLQNGYTSSSGWYGTSAGFPAFITTTALLPPAATGQSVRLRWRFIADYSVSGVGWYVDSVAVTGTYTCCAGCPDFLPPVVTGNQMSLSFPTAVGRTYRLLRSATLLPPDWQPVQTAPGTGGVVSLMVPVAEAGNAYYRLALE